MFSSPLQPGVPANQGGDGGHTAAAAVLIDGRLSSRLGDVLFDELVSWELRSGQEKGPATVNLDSKLRGSIRGRVRLRPWEVKRRHSQAALPAATKVLEIELA